MGNGYAWLRLVLCVVYIVRKNAKVMLTAVRLAVVVTGKALRCRCSLHVASATPVDATTYRIRHLSVSSWSIERSKALR